MVKVAAWVRLFDTIITFFLLSGGRLKFDIFEVIRCRICGRVSIPAYSDFYYLHRPRDSKSARGRSNWKIIRFPLGYTAEFRLYSGKSLEISARFVHLLDLVDFALRFLGAVSCNRAECRFP